MIWFLLLHTFFFFRISSYSLSIALLDTIGAAFLFFSFSYIVFPIYHDFDQC